MIDVTPNVSAALDTWMVAHDRAVPGLVVGLHLVGSAALGDWQPGRDIDIVAVVSDLPTPDDVQALAAIAATSAGESAVGPIDGPYLIADDLRSPPRPVTRPWTLAHEFRHDDGCFEINPVVWATLARHAVTVRGTPAGELDIDDDPAALHDFVVDNTATYWTSVLATIEQALGDRERTTFRSETISWSVLGLARMLLTARTGRIASKTAAGEWVRTELPDHDGTVRLALDVRAAPDHPDVDRAAAFEAATFMRCAIDLVCSSRRS